MRAHIICTVLTGLLLATPSPSSAADETDAIEGVLTGVLQGIEKCGAPKIKGICWKGLDVGTDISHGLPVAFVEVVHYPLDSVLIPGSVTGGVAGGMATRTSGSRKNSGVTYEARVWGIDDKIRNYLSAGLSKCLWCSDRQADSKPPRGYAGIGGRAGRALASTNDALSWLLGCSPANTALEQAMNEAQKEMGDSPIPLLYSSELDAVGWRQGCRDAVAGLIYSGVSLPMCGGWGMISSAGTGLFNSMGEVGERLNIDALENAPALNRYLDAGRDFINSSNACLGDWGNAYPRVYRVEGASEQLAAVTVAWRALSLSRTAVKSMKFDVSTRGQLQQVYPEVQSECFKIGAPVSEVSDKLDSGGANPLEEGGRYVFIYWAQVGCCYEGLNVAACYANYMGGGALEGVGEIQEFQNMFPELPNPDEIMDDIKGGLEADIEEWWDSVGEEGEEGEGDGGG